MLCLSFATGHSLTRLFYPSPRSEAQGAGRAPINITVGSCSGGLPGKEGLFPLPSLTAPQGPLRSVLRSYRPPSVIKLLQHPPSWRPWQCLPVSRLLSDVGHFQDCRPGRSLGFSFLICKQKKLDITFGFLKELNGIK